MTNPWTRPYSGMIILMIITGILSGCASVFQNIDGVISHEGVESDRTALEAALSVYETGDFETALNRFKTLTTTSAYKKITRRAWLGEICCRLMLAETQTDYTAAINMWHEFGDTSPDNDSTGDLALFDPLILRLTPPEPPPMAENHLPAAAPPNRTATPANQQVEDRQQADRQLQAELIDLKQKAERAVQLQQRLDQVEAENLALKEKIKALEAIDQKIQKKKTKISAPSE